MLDNLDNLIQSALKKRIEQAIDEETSKAHEQVRKRMASILTDVLIEVNSYVKIEDHTHQLIISIIKDKI